MPVFLVTINATGQSMPELLGLVAGQPTAEAAVAWTCMGEPIEVRDITVAQLSSRNDCWYQPGPDDLQ